MNVTNTPDYAWGIAGNCPPDTQHPNNSFPSPAYMPQPSTMFIYPTAPQYLPPPLYSPQLQYGIQIPFEQFHPPQPANLYQQPYASSNFGPSNNNSIISSSSTSSSNYSSPAIPFRPAPPVPPILNEQSLTNHNIDGTSPSSNINRNSEHGIGFMNLTNELSLYPPLQGLEIPQNSKHIATPLPDDLIVLWESCKAAKLYFVQQEGHVVSPGEDLIFRACKFPPDTQNMGRPVGSLSGQAKGASLLVTMEKAWRLGLSRDRSYLVKGNCGEIAFYDTSTSPARYVIIIFSKEVTKEDRQRLFVLLQASSRMVDEPSNMVDKLESNVESVFDSLTQNMDSLVKKGTPNVIHKNTKWLRKGTGNLVRLGGGIVSKGVHLVSDNVMGKEAPKDSCQQHKHLFEALTNVRQAIENKTVTTVLPL